MPDTPDDAPSHFDRDNDQTGHFEAGNSTRPVIRVEEALITKKVLVSVVAIVEGLYVVGEAILRQSC